MWIDPYGLCSVKYDYWSAFSGQGSAYVNDVIDYFADIFTAPGDYYERFNEAGLSTPVALVETVIFSGGKIFGYGLFMEGVVGIDVRSGTETHGWQRKTQLIFGGIGTGATAIAGANSLNAALPSSGPAAVSHWGSKGLETNSWVMKDKPSPSNYFRSGKWSRLGGNQVAPYGSGQPYTVPGETLRYPSGWEALKGPPRTAHLYWTTYTTTIKYAKMQCRIYGFRT